jgi:hypothetical protein
MGVLIGQRPVPSFHVKHAPSEPRRKAPSIGGEGVSAIMGALAGTPSSRSAARVGAVQMIELGTVRPSRQGS